MEKCLLLVLRPRLAFAWIETPPPTKIRLRGQDSRRTDDSEFTGFYDWLRYRSGVILGVRYWPFVDLPHKEELRSFFSAARSLPYACVSESDSFLEIYFSMNRDINPDDSDDQDFGHVTYYGSESGEYAIALEPVDDEIRRAVQDALLRWQIPSEGSCVTSRELMERVEKAAVYSHGLRWCPLVRESLGRGFPSETR